MISEASARLNRYLLQSSAIIQIADIFIANPEKKFKRYGFSAMPVHDEEDTIHSVASHGEIMQLESNYPWVHGIWHL